VGLGAENQAMHALLDHLAGAITGSSTLDYSIEDAAIALATNDALTSRFNMSWCSHEKHRKNRWRLDAGAERAGGAAGDIPVTDAQCNSASGAYRRKQPRISPGIQAAHSISRRTKFRHQQGIDLLVSTWRWGDSREACRAQMIVVDLNILL